MEGASNHFGTSLFARLVYFPDLGVPLVAGLRLLRICFLLEESKMISSSVSDSLTIRLVSW